jgi:hypothetical protein
MNTGKRIISVRGPVSNQVDVPSAITARLQYAASGQCRQHANASVASSIAAITPSSSWNSNAVLALNACRKAAHQVVRAAWNGVDRCRSHPVRSAVDQVSRFPVCSHRYAA